jgi:hypothetical protein
MYDNRISCFEILVNFDDIHFRNVFVVSFLLQVIFSLGFDILTPVLLFLVELADV